MKKLLSILFCVLALRCAGSQSFMINSNGVAVQKVVTNLTWLGTTNLSASNIYGGNFYGDGSGLTNINITNGVTGKLASTNNLSDVGNTNTALVNLGGAKQVDLLSVSNAFMILSTNFNTLWLTNFPALSNSFGIVSSNFNTWSNVWTTNLATNNLRIASLSSTSATLVASLNLVSNIAVLKVDNSGGLVTNLTSTNTTLQGPTLLAGKSGNRILATDVGGNIITTSASDTQAGYLANVTGDLQTQLNQKAGVGHPHAGSDITSGIIAVARLGSGSGSSGDFLDGTGNFRSPGTFTNAINNYDTTQFGTNSAGKVNIKNAATVTNVVTHGSLDADVLSVHEGLTVSGLAVSDQYYSGDYEVASPGGINFLGEFAGVTFDNDDSGTMMLTQSTGFPASLNVGLLSADSLLVTNFASFKTNVGIGGALAVTNAATFKTNVAILGALSGLGATNFVKQQITGSGVTTNGNGSLTISGGGGAIETNLFTKTTSLYLTNITSGDWVTIIDTTNKLVAGFLRIHGRSAGSDTADIIVHLDVTTDDDTSPISICQFQGAQFGGAFHLYAQSSASENHFTLAIQPNASSYGFYIDGFGTNIPPLRSIVTNSSQPADITDKIQGVMVALVNGQIRANSLQAKKFTVVDGLGNTEDFVSDDDDDITSGYQLGGGNAKGAFNSLSANSATVSTVNAGGLGTGVFDVSSDANVSADINQVFNVDASSGPVSLILDGVAGRHAQVRKMDSSANAVTVTDTSAFLFNGGSSIVLTNQYQTVSCVKNNAGDWNIESAYNP